MMNFCTYFDSYYMLKGLGLYTSLERVAKDFHLYVMAFDKECFDKLKSLNLKHMTVESLSDIETPELLNIKQKRTKVEYCWTCGPVSICHFITKYNLDLITYLDSDLMFMMDPSVVFQEIDSASIAITEQGINEKNAKAYGKYCVQYMTFRNDDDGIGALTWWKDSCIEWCYQKLEATRYADQKYLDEFPKRWANVHIINNLGVGIAPWNMHRYQYNMKTLKYKGIEYPYVFFHFHGVKIESIDDTLHLSSLHHELNDVLINKFYTPYGYLLMDVLNNLLGYHLKSVVVHDMPFFKKINYRLRGLVRGNEFIRWFWFVLYKKNHKGLGHGSKF